MPKTNTPAFTQTIVHTQTQVLPADTTTAKTICTGGTNDSRVTHITICTDDSAANIAFFTLNDYPIGTIAIPNNSGMDSTTIPVAILSAENWLHRKLDNNANPYFELANGAILKVSVQNTVTAAKTIWVTVTKEDY